MKKISLALLLTFVFTPAVKAADTTSAPEKTLSFRQLLRAVAGEYDKSAAVPEAKPSGDASDFGLIDDNRWWLTVQAKNKYERTRLLELGMDIVEVEANGVSGIVYEKSVQPIQENGFVIEKKTPLKQFVALKDFPPGDSAYHNYDELSAVLKEIALGNTDIASLFSIGKTLEGRDIWALRVNSSAKGEEKSDKPGAVFIGAHHAREHLTVEVTLLYAVWLLENRNTPEVKKYLDTLDVYIIPMLNPDGAEYDIKTGKYKMHRKNMRVNQDKSVGVDLNRNYGMRWGGQGSSHSPYSDTFCGTAAFSEPETQAVKRFVEGRKNLKTMLTYHSYSELILYPWAGSDQPLGNAKDLKVFVTMAQTMAKFNGYTPEQASDLYVATGDTTDWAYSSAGIFAFTIELTPKQWGAGGFYPGAGVIEKTVNDHIKVNMYTLSMTADPYQAAR